MLFFESHSNASVTSSELVTGLNRGKSKDMPCSLLGADHCLSENHNKITEKKRGTAHVCFMSLVRHVCGLSLVAFALRRWFSISLVCSGDGFVQERCLSSEFVLRFKIPKGFHKRFVRLTNVGSAGNRIATTYIATSGKTAHEFSLAKASCLVSVKCRRIELNLLTCRHHECLQSHSFIVPGILHLTFSGCSSSAHFSADLCTP